MKLKTRNKEGFTLIELLVVIAVIGVLATIVLSSLAQSRIRAKDAAIVSSLSSYRNTAELEYHGNFSTLCSGQSFVDIQTYIESNGGSIESCDDAEDSYRIIANLPSSIAYAFTNIAYASGEDAVCSNSNGFLMKSFVNQASKLPSPFCDLDEEGITPCAHSGQCSTGETCNAQSLCLNPPISECSYNANGILICPNVCYGFCVKGR